MLLLITYIVHSASPCVDNTSLITRVLLNTGGNWPVWCSTKVPGSLNGTTWKTRAYLMEEWHQSAPHQISRLIPAAQTASQTEVSRSHFRLASRQTLISLLSSVTSPKRFPRSVYKMNNHRPKPTQQRAISFVFHPWAPGRERVCWEKVRRRGGRLVLSTSWELKTSKNFTWLLTQLLFSEVM